MVREKINLDPVRLGIDPELDQEGRDRLVPLFLLLQRNAGVLKEALTGYSTVDEIRQVRDTNLEAAPKGVHKRRVAQALGVAAAALENCDTAAIDLDARTATEVRKQLDKQRAEYRRESRGPLDNSVVQLGTITTEVIKRSVVFDTPTDAAALLPTVA